jgi:hypothetical protein
VELAGGFMLLVLNPAEIHRFVVRMTQPELSEDPKDFIATNLLHAAGTLSGSAVLYGRLRGASGRRVLWRPRHSAVTVAAPCSLVKCAGRLTGSGQAVRTPRKRRKQRCPSKTALPNQSAPPRRQ